MTMLNYEKMIVNEEQFKELFISGEIEYEFYEYVEDNKRAVSLTPEEYQAAKVMLGIDTRIESMEPKIIEGIRSIRESGETNMFNYHRVMKIANDRGMFQVVTWMYDNKEEYIQGILSGFTAKT